MANLPNAIEFRKAIEEELSINQVDHFEFAKQLNIKPSHLSCLKKGRANLVPVDVKRKVWNTIRPSRWQIVSTYNFQVIQKYCEDTRNNRMFNALIGEAGLGKTTALKHFSKGKPSVIMVTYDITMKPKDLFATMLEELKVEFNGSINATLKKLSDELLTRDNTLIIIDESDKMPIKLFNYIHVLRNNTQNQAAILLSGVPGMKKRIDTASSRSVQGISEFKSRVMHWEFLTSPIRAEILDICEANCIDDKALIKELCKCINYREMYNKVMVHKLSNEFPK